jgi:CBS domain-containing membrane protein
MPEQCDPTLDPDNVSDEDIHEAMRQIEGYLDITTRDFREVYRTAYRHALRRLKSTVKAADIMTRPVHSVRRDEAALVAAGLMAEKRVAGLAVLEEDGRVAGVISEQDFLSRLNRGSNASVMAMIVALIENSSAPMDIRNLRVADLMSAPAVTVRENTPAGEIGALFRTRKINRVLVVDAEDQLLGIVARADLISIIPG